MNLKLLALALALPAAGPAAAQTAAHPTSPAAGGSVVAENPEAIAKLLQDWGYRAQLKKDDQGDPQIDSSTAGVNYTIYFYGCEGGRNCTSIQLSSGFDLTDGTTLAVVNDWNTNKRYSKVYLDDQNDPFIEIDVNLYGGGISEETFRDTLDLWDRLLADFQTHINW